MLLAVDAGNTNIVFGVFSGNEAVAIWRTATRPDRTADEYGAECLGLCRAHGIDPAGITGIIAASVVPPVNRVLDELGRKYFRQPVRFVESTSQNVLKIEYEPPDDAGADRIVNAAGAFLKYGAPLAVLDFGTATTFDAVAAGGVFRGGAIVPGIGVSAEVLFQKTSRLPRTAISRPAAAIGRSTVECIQSGLYFGSLYLIKGLVDLFKAELGPETRVIATGGLMDVFRPDMPWVDVFDANLTLEGLYQIHLRQYHGQ